jgi:hypothetical protein
LSYLWRRDIKLEQAAEINDTARTLEGDSQKISLRAGQSGVIGAINTITSAA